MSRKSNRAEEIMNSEIPRDGSFRFECQMCGMCCKNRTEPILVTGTDVFRFSRALDMSIRDSLNLNCEFYIGSDSHVPVCVLKERMDGSCRLMRKGRCMVQEQKPAVCALYPIGRFYNGEDGSYHYFSSRENNCPGTMADHEWALADWIENFHLEDNMEDIKTWHKLLFGISNVTCRMDKRRIEKNVELVGLMIAVLYGNYRYDFPYVAQVEANMELARIYFKHKLNRELEF